MWVSYLENEVDAKSPISPQEKKQGKDQAKEQQEPEVPVEHASIFARLLGV
jgi:hypothetical protein